MGTPFTGGGAAFEFDAETGKFLTAYLRPYPGADGFGDSVKVLGEAVLIGAPYAKKKEDDIVVGAAFLFQAKNPGSFTDFTQPLASFTDFTQPLASFFNPIDETECKQCFARNITLDSDGIVLANPNFTDPEVGARVGEVYFYKDSTGALAELTQSRTNESIAVDIDSVNNVSNSLDFLDLSYDLENFDLEYHRQKSLELYDQQHKSYTKENLYDFSYHKNGVNANIVEALDAFVNRHYQDLVARYLR